MEPAMLPKSKRTGNINCTIGVIFLFVISRMPTNGMIRKDAAVMSMDHIFDLGLLSLRRLQHYFWIICPPIQIQDQSIREILASTGIKNDVLRANREPSENRESVYRRVLYSTILSTHSI